MISEILVLVLCVLAVLPAPAQAQTNSNAEIQHLSEQLLLGSEVTVARATLASSHIIPEFYSRREFTPAWTNDDQVDEYLQLIGRAYEEGLDPDDYLCTELSDLVGDFRRVDAR